MASSTNDANECGKRSAPGSERTTGLFHGGSVAQGSRSRFWLLLLGVGAGLTFVAVCVGGGDHRRRRRGR